MVLVEAFIAIVCKMGSILSIAVWFLFVDNCSKSNPIIKLPSIFDTLGFGPLVFCSSIWGCMSYQMSNNSVKLVAFLFCLTFYNIRIFFFNNIHVNVIAIYYLVVFTNRFHKS